ncbi:hypothetical protein [Agromyces sp. Marseille-Q5079]|uniref:hypothetical protein n=1 Tax=Agromyces sp. Marseille-Q5079 TaxID=3439059 RepID=UPI003D9C8341
MTQNRRSGTRLDENLARAARADEDRGTPIGLSIDELGTTGRRTDARIPVRVDARVRLRVITEEPRLIEGEAVAWTRGAVLVRWQHGGHDMHTWVWASAVRRH